MRKTIVQCDRCGANIESYSAYALEIREKRQHPAYVNQYGQMSIQQLFFWHRKVLNLEICEDCSDAIAKFITGFKNGENP